MNPFFVLSVYCEAEQTPSLCHGTGPWVALLTATSIFVSRSCTRPQTTTFQYLFTLNSACRILPAGCEEEEQEDQAGQVGVVLLRGAGRRRRFAAAWPRAGAELLAGSFRASLLPPGEQLGKAWLRPSSWGSWKQN